MRIPANSPTNKSYNVSVSNGLIGYSGFCAAFFSTTDLVAEEALVSDVLGLLIPELLVSATAVSVLFTAWLAQPKLNNADNTRRNSEIRLLIFIRARVFGFACNMFSIVKSVRAVKGLLVVKKIIKYASIGIVAKYYDNNESRRFQFNLSYL